MNNLNFIIKIALMTAIIYVGAILEIFTQGLIWGFSIDIALFIFIVFASILEFKETLILALFVAFLYPLISFNPWYLKSLISYFLEGSLPFFLFSTVSLLKYDSNKKIKYFVLLTLLLIVLYILKLFIHTIAGVIVWDTTWWMSFLLNAPYCSFNLLLAILIVVPMIGLFKHLKINSKIKANNYN